MCVFHHPAAGSLLLRPLCKMLFQLSEASGESGGRAWVQGLSTLTHFITQRNNVIVPPPKESISSYLQCSLPPSPPPPPPHTHTHSQHAVRWRASRVSPASFPRQPCCCLCCSCQPILPPPALTTSRRSHTVHIRSCDSHVTGLLLINALHSHPVGVVSAADVCGQCCDDVAATLLPLPLLSPPPHHHHPHQCHHVLPSGPLQTG